MCHDNPNLDAALNNMEAAAEQLSGVQEKVNKPLFDLLFQLVNMPQTPGLAGAKLKVLHTYAHRFMEFYMTECPDGVSIHTINPNAVHTISSKLRALGDGLARLLSYLGLEQENETLTECVDNLAVAYDAFAAMMSRVDAIHDEFYDEDDDDCDCDCCGCGCCCDEDDDEDDTSWVNEHREDEGAEEFDPCADYPNACSEDGCADRKCGGATAAEADAAQKLFEALFGFNPEAAAPKAEAKPQPKPSEHEADMFATEMAQILAKMLGLKEGDVTVRRVKNEERKNTAATAQAVNAEENGQKNASKEAARPQVRRVVVREVMPGFWRFG